MSADPPGAPPEGEGEPAPLPPPPRYRRFAPLILIAGAIGAGIALLPHLPRERKVELRLEDTAAIVEVDLSVSRSSDGEQVHGGAWHFAPGSAPASIRTSMSLPSGRYEVDVTVDRPPDRRTIHRVISLDDGDEITIPVR